MIFYEFNDFGYYALIGAYTMEDALKEYRNVADDMVEEELTPDVLTEKEAKEKYCKCLIEQEEENKIYEEFGKEFEEFKKNKKTHLFLIDGNLL